MGWVVRSGSTRLRAARLAAPLIVLTPRLRAARLAAPLIMLAAALLLLAATLVMLGPLLGLTGLARSRGTGLPRTLRGLRILVALLLVLGGIVDRIVVFRIGH
jgi:hypothetical protein